MQRRLLFALLVAPLTFCVAAEPPEAVDPPAAGAAAEARETALANSVPVSEAEDSRWTRTLEKVATGVVTMDGTFVLAGGDDDLEMDLKGDFHFVVPCTSGC